MFIANLSDAALYPEAKEIKFWSIDDSFTTEFMQILYIFLLFKFIHFFWGWIVTSILVNPSPTSAEIQSFLLNRGRSIKFWWTISSILAEDFILLSSLLFQYFINPLQGNVFWDKAYYILFFYTFSSEVI